jgi:hypothetical protein
MTGSGLSSPHSPTPPLPNTHTTSSALNSSPTILGWKGQPRTCCHSLAILPITTGDSGHSKAAAEHSVPPFSINGSSYCRGKPGVKSLFRGNDLSIGRLIRPEMKKSQSLEKKNMPRPKHASLGSPFLSWPRSRVQVGDLFPGLWQVKCLLLA